MMYEPPSMAEYTAGNYNSDGTSKFNPGTPSDKDQQATLDDLQKKKQDFFQQYGIGGSGGPQGGGALHQLGTSAAMAGASALAGGAGASGAGAAILGAL